VTANRTFVGLLALALAGACSQAPRPPSPEVFTLFDAQRLTTAFGPDHRIATTSGVPGGVKLSAMLDASDPMRLASDPTRTGGDEQGTYATTEVWNHFDRLWIQPMYVLVSRWENGRPIVWPPPPGDAALRSWIFSVGPESGFYSPFWQMIYVDVPDEATARTLTSARQILEGGYTRHAGPGHMVALAPEGLLPPDGTKVGIGRAWLDGKPVNFFDFGTGTFSWDAEGVVTEIPIYVFLMRNMQGNWVAPPIPTVSGIAPHGTAITGDTRPPFIGGDYRWASYWRIYTVKLPPAARVIAPKDSAIWTALGELELARADDIAPAVYAADARIGTVQLNPGPAFGSTDPDGGAPASGCFADNTGCQPVDSQYRIQKDIDPSAIARTDLTVTCPFMTFEGKAVGPLP
jgi:hypothetical protein